MLLTSLSPFGLKIGTSSNFTISSLTVNSPVLFKLDSSYVIVDPVINVL